MRANLITKKKQESDIGSFSNPPNEKRWKPVGLRNFVKGKMQY